MPRTDGEYEKETKGPRYILITQCLQNDFFLSRASRLRLPDSQVERILVGKKGPPLGTDPETARLKCPSGFPARGPLGLFLDAVIGARSRGECSHGVLHVINIRDWHQAGPNYDKERSLYGPHCEESTWGARYLEGLEQYLDPDSADSREKGSEQAAFYRKGSVRIYHILSDYIFDFKPHSSSGTPHQISKFESSKLEQILDIIMLGSPSQVEQLATILEQREHPPSPVELKSLAVEAQTSGEGPSELYVAVIGVYTDIKVKTILSSLSARYEIPNLAVSDTLTASPTLERHLESLDFAQKVLGVAVIHGLNDLIRFLGGGKEVENELEVVAADRFSDYVTFFQDKQNVLAYEREKLQDYLRLTQRRSERVYRYVEWGNKILIGSGALLLLLCIVSVLLELLLPGRYSVKLPLATGGLGLLQIVTAFFSRPMTDIQKNLTNMATFRMILETHSLKTALARFHLTTPQVLRENVDPHEAAQQVAALKAQFEVLETLERDYQVLKGLGFGPTGKKKEATAPDAK